MATYTQTDLDAVRAAKLAYVSGKRVRRVTVGGKTIEYSDDANVYDHLTALEVEIRAELSTPALRTYAKQGGRCR